MSFSLRGPAPPPLQSSRRAKGPAPRWRGRAGRRVVRVFTGTPQRRWRGTPYRLPASDWRPTGSSARPRGRHKGKPGTSLMWMPAQTTRPPLRTCSSASGTSAPTGAKRIAASSASGGAWPRILRRGAAERAARRPAPAPSPGRVKAWTAAAGRDLGEDMGGGAEAVEAERLPFPGQLQRAPADQPGAEQRRRLDVADRRRGSGSSSARRRRHGWRSRRRG